MRILIVEDDPFVALDIECIVQDSVAADVQLAATLAQAKRCTSQPLDFAFLDIDMPDGKIFEVAAELRGRGVPFAFVSGERLEEVPSLLRDAPFISKPYKVWQISQTLPGMRASSDAPRPA